MIVNRTNTAMLVTIMMFSTNVKPWFTMRSPKTSANKTVPTIIAHTFRLKASMPTIAAMTPAAQTAIPKWTKDVSQAFWSIPAARVPLRPICKWKETRKCGEVQG